MNKEALREKYFAKQFQSPVKGRPSTAAPPDVGSPTPTNYRTNNTTSSKPSSSHQSIDIKVRSPGFTAPQPQQTAEHNEPVSSPSPFSKAPPVSNNSIMESKTSEVHHPINANTVNEPIMEQVESAHQPRVTKRDADDEQRWGLPDLYSIVYMKHLNLHEKLLVVLFLFAMIYFQCKFSVEDVLSVDWLAVARDGVLFVEDVVVNVAVHLYYTIEQQYRRVNKVYLLSSVTLGVMASIAFDYDIQQTDKFVHKCWERVIRDAEYGILLCSAIYNFFHNIIVDTIQYFLDLPTVWQYVIGITAATSLVKYGIVHYLVSIQPVIFAFLVVNFYYYGPVLFLFVLFKLTSLWRAKMAKREEVVRNVCQRAVDILSSKFEFYSNLKLLDDISKDGSVDLQGYELDSLWPDVKALVKKEAGVQVNDFKVGGEHIQYWGFKANSPAPPAI